MEFRKKFLKKFQDSFFNIRMGINAFLGLPAQTGRERALYRKILDIMASREGLHIFEWGSGLSTVYYARYLTKKGISFEWHAIDNNKHWHEKVKNMVKSKDFSGRVHLYLKEFLPFWQKPGWGVIPPPCGVFSPKEDNELAYINFPKTIRDKFDVVIIDARFRRYCLSVAKDVLAPGGIVILHDAQKPHYQVGLEIFPYRKLIESGAWAPFQELCNQVWVGALDNQKLLDSLKEL